MSTTTPIAPFHPSQPEEALPPISAGDIPDDKNDHPPQDLILKVSEFTSTAEIMI